MYDKNNIFAKIISGEVAAEKLYEDEKIIAIHDKNPAAPVHILIIPKQAYIDFADFIANAPAADVSHYYQTISKIASLQGVDEYRLITNKGKKAGQSVFHFHTHLIGGKSITELIDSGL
jgi:diadenosine tetraphosphate (Ap4A) HIT family hydrolase